MAKVKFDARDLKGGHIDVSNILEVDKKGLMTKGYKKLTDLFPKGFIFLEMEPYMPYVNGRVGTEVQGYDIKCLNVDTSNSFTIRVADELPSELPSMSKVDFENVLVNERIKTSGSGQYASNELIRGMIATRMVKVNDRPNTQPINQDKK